MHASGWIERQSPTQHGCLQQPASRGERRCRLKVNRLAAMPVPRNVPHSHARHCHSSSSRTHAKTPRYLQTYRPRPHTQCTGGCMQRRDVMQLAFHRRSSTYLHNISGLFIDKAWHARPARPIEHVAQSHVGVTPMGRSHMPLKARARSSLPVHINYNSIKE